MWRTDLLIDAAEAAVRRREAELAAEQPYQEWLDAGLFKLVHQWEEAAGTPCFQYIVTTTTAPPKELQNDEYVRLEMSSTPAEQRLFAMDI